MAPSWLGPVSVELGEPSQCSQARRKAVLAAARYDEWGRVLKPPTDWLPRDGERTGLIILPDEWVVLCRGADKDAVVQPLGFYEFELAPYMRADECEHDAAVGAIVFEHPLGQERAVARAASDHAV